MVLGLLGPLETGDVVLRPQERRVLSALVLHQGAVVTPDQLADACWGEVLPSTWWQQVKSSVARIRRVLGPGVIVTDSHGYAFGWDAGSVDSTRFERLIASAREHVQRGDDDRALHNYDSALALWRGRAFEDLSAWLPAAIEAERLSEIRATAEEEYLSARLRKGLAADVLPDAERLVRQEPLREVRWRLLALANYQTDRQGEALAVLRAGRIRLRDELGIDPGARHDELEAAILRQSPTLAPVVRPALSTGSCPYPGLRAFDAEDAEDFFGREREIDLLMARVTAGEILTVTGPSGSGKSSLVRAGLLPRLAHRDRATQVIKPSAAAVHTLRSWRASPAATDVIVIDQFEELWRAEAGLMDQFLAATQLALDRRVAVIVAVRSDFLDAATSLQHIGGQIGRNVFAVGPLTREAIREAIELPAKRNGLQVESGLTELILRDGGTLPTGLPYLSHALAETWAHREGGTMTVSGYTAAGGIAGAIAQSAEDLYRHLSPADQATCHLLLLRLVERTVEGASIRRHVESAPLMENLRMRVVIDKLLAARLVSIDSSSITLTHEAIAEAWPRLDQWLQENADDDRMLRDLQAASTRWSAGSRIDDDLARGARLHSYLTWTEALLPTLTRVERDFLDASIERESGDLSALATRAARDRRRVRTLRWALGAAAALLVISVVSGGVAVVGARNATAAEVDAKTTAVAANARSLLTKDRDLSALLAAELYRRDPTDSRAKSALMEVVTAPSTPTSKVSFASGERVSAAAIPGTTRMFVVVDPSPGDPHKGARIEVWDLADRSLVQSLDIALPANETRTDRFVSIDPQGARAFVTTPVWQDNVPGDCCLSTISSIELLSGKVQNRVIGLKVSDEAAMAADGSELTFVDQLSGRPVWIRTDTLDVTTTATPRSVTDAPLVSNAIAALPQGAVAIGLPPASAGGRDGTVQISDASHVVTRSIPLPGDVATWSMSSTPDGLLLTAGPDGIALLGTETGDILWRQGPVASRPCRLVHVISPASAVCVGKESWELRLSDGLPTGRIFDRQANSVVSIDSLHEGSMTVVGNTAPAFLERFPLDGTGPISQMIARGQQVAGDFLDDDTIITSPIASGDVPLAESTRRWSVAGDIPVAGTTRDLYVVNHGVAQLWTKDFEATVLADVRALGGWRTTGDFHVPGDQLTPVDGGAGRDSFAIADDWIVPFDPETGHIVGPPLDFHGKQLHYRPVMVHEIPDKKEAIVTWWDRNDAENHTAIFDLVHGTEIARGLPGNVATVSLPDDRILSATLSGVQIDSIGLKPQRVLVKPDSVGDVFDLSADGSTVLLEAVDGNAALYDVSSSAKIAEIETDSPSWESAHLSPDGLKLVTNVPDGVLLWDLRPSAMAAAACRLAGRGLTQTEWETYFPGDRYVDACQAIDARAAS